MLASLGAAGAITGLSSHFVTTAGIVALGAAALLQIRRNRLRSAAKHRQELALRKELLAYLLFNGSPRSMAAPDLGRQVSRLVAVRSSFGRAALILRDEAGVLSVAGSAGFDDLAVQALNRWGERVSGKDVSLAEIAAGSDRIASSSFTLRLDRRCEDRNPLSTMSCKSVHILPLRTARGIVGALAVCAEPRSSARTHDPVELIRHPGAATLPLADLLQPLEALALRLTMQLAAPENVTPLWPARTTPRQDRHNPCHCRARSAGKVSGRHEATQHRRGDLSARYPQHRSRARSRSPGSEPLRGADRTHRRRLRPASRTPLAPERRSCPRPDPHTCDRRAGRASQSAMAKAASVRLEPR